MVPKPVLEASLPYTFCMSPLSKGRYTTSRWLKFFHVGAWSVGPSDHSDWLFSRRTSAWEKRRTNVLLGHRVSSDNVVCQGNFGPQCCRRELTLQSAFVATSSSASAWCVPGLTHLIPLISSLVETARTKLCVWLGRHTKCSGQMSSRFGKQWLK